MPSGLGKLIRKLQQDFVFQGATATALSTPCFIAWHTGDPLDDGSATNEVGNTNNYARTSFTFGTTNWNAATTPSNDAASIVTNKLTITTATASGSWGTITFFSLRIVSTIGDVASGNFIARGAVSPGQVVGNGQFITIPAGSASFTNNSS
jgi:hypothetical protein